MKNVLIGKWEFVGAQKFQNETWVNSNNFVKGMTWEFSPQFIDLERAVGQIVETAPDSDPITMPYKFNAAKALLRVEILDEGDPVASKSDVADNYQLSFEESPIDAVEHIRISIIDKTLGPTLQLAYILRKVD